MLRAVIFDFDGTVADTIPAIAEGVNMTMQLYGFPLHTEAEVRTFINNGPRMLIRRALPIDLQNDEELLDRVLTDYDRLYKMVCMHTDHPYDGIPTVIETLRRQGLRIGILSNKQDHLVKKLCEGVLPGGYDTALGSLPGKPTKPDPFLSNQIASELGVKPEECIMIGDSDVDIATAKAAGMTHIGVSWGYRDEAFLRAHGAVRIAHTPKELLTEIETIQRNERN